MKDYHVIANFFKLSNQKSYSIGGKISLGAEEAVRLIASRHIAKRKQSKPKI